MRWLLVLLLLGGCQHKTPDERLADAAQPVASWAASLSFAAEQWSANSVPNRFIRTATDAANKALDKSAKDVEQSTGRRDLRDRIAHDIAQVRQLSASLNAAAERGDRTSAGSAAATLAHIAADLKDAR
jgi:hypothetical protein